jgi:hypothetical protein
MRIEDVFMMGEKAVEFPRHPDHTALNRKRKF